MEQKQYTIKQHTSRRAEEITVTIQLNVGLHISTKNGVMQLKLRTLYESICYKEKPEPRQKNINFLRETQNKYLGEKETAFRKLVV